MSKLGLLYFQLLYHVCLILLENFSWEIELQWPCGYYIIAKYFRILFNAVLTIIYYLNKLIMISPNCWKYKLFVSYLETKLYYFMCLIFFLSSHPFKLSTLLVFQITRRRCHISLYETVIQAIIVKNQLLVFRSYKV